MSGRNSDDYEKEGREWLLRNEADTALRVFRDGLAQFPGDRELLLGTAMAHIDLGDFVRAIEIVKPLLQSHPQWGDALQAMAEAHLRMGKTRRAVEFIEQATGDHERDAEFVNSLGLLLFRHGLCREAAECHRKAVERDPRFGPAYMGLGVCRHKLGDVPGAIDAIQKAVSVSPGYFEALCYLGHLLYDLRKKSEARLAWFQIPIEHLWDERAIARILPLCPGPENIERRKALRARQKELARRPAASKKGDAVAAMKKLGERMDQASLARNSEPGGGSWCCLPSLLAAPTLKLGIKLGELGGKMFERPLDTERSNLRLVRFDRSRAERYMLLLSDFLDQYPWACPKNAGIDFRDSAGSEAHRRQRDVQVFEWADVSTLLLHGKVLVAETRRRLDRKIQPTVAIVTLREAMERLKAHVPEKSIHWKAWVELRAALEP